MTDNDKDKAKLTTYVIFEVRSTEESDDPLASMKRVDEIDARTAKMAIQSVVREGGVYVAVPQRSLQPVQVTIENKPQVKLS